MLCSHDTDGEAPTFAPPIDTNALAMKLNTLSVAVAIAEATMSTTDSATAFTPPANQPFAQQTGLIPHSENDGIPLLLLLSLC